MISREQQERALREAQDAASKAYATASWAERDYEEYMYRSRPNDPGIAAAKRLAAEEADYQAESKAWIVNLITEAMKSQP